MNTMMWGYYADKTRGVCIEFDYDKLKIPNDVLKSIVTYCDIQPQQTDIPDSITTIRELKGHIVEEQNKLFFTKQKGWAGEKEYRLVCNNQDYLEIDGAISCIYLTSYESDECVWVEQLVQDEVPVMYLHYFNNLPVASNAKRTREQAEKAQNSTGILRQMSEQAKRYYEEHKYDENASLILNKYYLNE